MIVIWIILALFAGTDVATGVSQPSPTPSTEARP
jgi:hypothetical protein